jgi:hypothetical protein
MSKKDTNFFEEHVEKIVLVIVGIVCLWLFITRVLFSSVDVKYDNGKFDPGTIDKHISEQAGVLEKEIDRPPQPQPPYHPRVNDFNALLVSAIPDINSRLVLPIPFGSTITDNRKYHIPSVGEVNDVSVGYIRAVAYVPKGNVSEENVYSSDNSEPNDIDFVTVEAKFDVSGLYKRYNECFAGGYVQKDWRDPSIANPVFAAVQLQRQKLLPNGSWSDWQNVPRSKVDARKSMFKIIENINDLPFGGLKVRMLQFDNAAVRMDLLQPQAYQIASAKELWLPPTLHEKYLEYQKEIDVMGRREAAAGKREERVAERSERRGRQVVSKPRQPLEGGVDGVGMGMSGGIDGERSPSIFTPARRTPTRRGQPERETERERPQKSSEVSRTIDDIYKEFSEISITETTNIDRMDKPLSFWANDDTVEPGNSYRYRIRLGVFNPIAATNQFYEQDEALKNKVILWSKFSDVTQTVDIPAFVYFFPRGIQGALEAVTVQVCRYVLGYWYSKDFTVKRGELIGKADEYRITEEEEKKQVTVPRMVDYATGVVLVDIVPVNDWGDNLHARHFSDMLYSFDGKDISRLPVETRYWDDALQSKFNEIKRAEKEPKEPLRSWQSRPEQRGRVPLPTVERTLVPTPKTPM